MKIWIKAQKRKLILACSFIIPALIMTAIMINGQFFPFGKMSILMADLKCQFIDYIGYMKQIVYGNDDIFYSFSKTFGGDMSGFIAYYLSNPMFLMLLLVPNDLLPAGIVVMLIITAGGMGLCFYIFLRDVFGSRFSSLIFSTAYAFMGFSIGYINCVLYQFSIMMLPLVIMGLYRTVKKSRPSKVYVIALALAVASNYYMGYMIIIFTFLFFLFFSFSRLNKDRTVKEIAKVSWTVLYSTLLGIGISAASICAAYFSLKGQKSSNVSLSFSQNFRMTDIFANLFSGSFHGNISDGMPLIYSGIVTLVFLFFYFINKKIPIRERVAASLLFIFMMLSFWIDSLNVMWHGFAHPIGFPYRNSYMFSFLALFFGYWGFVCIKDSFRVLYLAAFLVLFIDYCAYLIFSSNNDVGVHQIVINLVLVIFTLCCIYILRMNWRYVIPAIIGLAFLQFSDLYYNGCVSLASFFPDKEALMDSVYSKDVYNDYYRETSVIIDKIKKNDAGFYRVDKLYRDNHNDPMLFGYNGLSHFSSTENASVKDFMGKLGFCHNDLWAYYGAGSTSFADCFMGLKYLVSQYDETCKPFEESFNYNGKYVFKNPYALPIAFGSDKKIKNINMNEKDPFILQNNIANALTGVKYEIYKPVELSKINLVNVEEKDGKYVRQNHDDEAYVEYILSVTSSNFIYMYFEAPEIQSTRLMVEDMEKQPIFTAYDKSIRECGYFKPGSKVSVRIFLEQDEITISDYYFYYENNQVLKSWYKDVAKTKCKVEKENSSRLAVDADVSLGTDIIMFSIPYEDDWFVFVDGNRAKTTKIMDALLSVQITSGEHKIELRYFPKGLVIGIPISVFSLITTFCVFFIGRKRKNTRLKNTKK